MTMKCLLLLPLLAVISTNIGHSQQPKSAMPTPQNNKIAVYQIYTRLFGNQNTTNKFYGSRDENGVGKMNDISAKALAEIKKTGMTHVWFTGIIEHATMTDYSAFGIAKDNPLVVKGKAGSAYAIKDYYDVNPDLAVNVKNRMKEFEALVARTHKANMKVILDCVPNHLAREYKSDMKPKGVKDFGQDDNNKKDFDPQNNFYYLSTRPFQVPDNVQIPPDVNVWAYNEFPAKVTGNDVFNEKPNINDWFETIKLNYGVDYQNNRAKHFDPTPSTWLKMRDVLIYWSKKGVDGFRCDMVEMVPVEFWAWVIPEVKKANPDAVFIAEIYNPAQYKNYLFTGQFDYLYDKVGLYDALRRLMEGHGNANDITKVWQNESGDFGNRMLRFLENHDEQRIASRFFANDPFKAIPAMTLSATLHGGPVMLYFGQEVGTKPTVAEGFSGDDGRTTMFDYWGVPEFQAWTNGGKFDGGKLSPDQKRLRSFYSDLFNMCQTSDAIKNGAFYDLQYAQSYNTSKIYSYLRHTATQKLLIVCNFDLDNGHETQINIPEHALQTMGLDPKISISMTDIFMQKSTKLQTGATLKLPPNSVFVFEVK